MHRKRLVTKQCIKDAKAKIKNRKETMRRLQASGGIQKNRKERKSARKIYEARSAFDHDAAWEDFKKFVIK